MTPAAASNPLDRSDLRELLMHLAQRCSSLPAAVFAAGPGFESPCLIESQFSWLAQLVGGPAGVAQLALTHFGAEIESADGCVLELPFMLIVLPILQRRRRVGTVIGLVARGGLSSHPLMDSLDLPVPDHGRHARDQLMDIPLPDQTSLPTLIQAVEWWLHDLGELRDASTHIESFGRQLTDAYEELALLQKVSRNMNVLRQPRQFLDSVCQDLLEVMPFRWTALKLSPTRPGCSEFADLLFTAGNFDCDRDRLLRVVDHIIATRTDNTPLVREEGLVCDCPELEALERSAVVQPLADSDSAYGAIIVGGKIGESAQVNSFDLKILGATAEHVRIFLDNVGLYDNLQKMFLGTLEAITASIDAKDRYTCGHSRRVAYLSRELARRSGLDEATIVRVHIAGLVHDVGKIGVPESVLSKPGRLTDDEFEMIKKHPEIGVRILRDIPNFEDIIPGVMSHHERFDGNGYPQRLKGLDIPLFGRVIGIADAFDAMSSTRTYRRALSSVDVLAEMQRCAGSQFDPDLIPHFLTLDFSVYEEMRDRDRAIEQQQSGVAA